MRYVSAQQLQSALAELALFTGAVGKQRAQHVLPFLALKLKGVKSGEFRPYSESDDREFYERFARVRQGHEPYFDPLEARFRIKTHYHSNVATARKGTFSKSWGAADLRKGAAEEKGPAKEEWRLADDYIDRIRARVLRRVGGKDENDVQPIPAVALAVFLYRTAPLQDSETYDSLRDRFFNEFGITADERSLLFSLETPKSLQGLPFASEPLLEKAIEEFAKAGHVPEAQEPADGKTGEEWNLVIDETDPILRRALELLYEDRMSGIVLVGPPGTSKSWYAVQIALYVAEHDPGRVHKIQFHKSYQYENFVESYAPKQDGSGFEMRDQLLLRVAGEAEARPDRQFVIVIDELSRSDPGRVFGEALTYMEPSRRGESFILPSGRKGRIPPNVVFVATMNARDKSVSEIDDAFDRRMGKIALDPSPELLSRFLERNEMSLELRRRVEAFFEWVNQKYYPLGHTFFLTVRDEEGMRRLWENQLRFAFEKEFRFQPETYKGIREKYEEIVFGAPPPPVQAAG